MIPETSTRQIDCSDGRRSDCSSNSGRTKWAYDKKIASFSAATAFAAYADDIEAMFDTTCWQDHWSDFGEPQKFKKFW